MPSFDFTSEADMVGLKNAIDVTSRQIDNRYDFKGTSASVELKEKEKEIHMVGDSDFQIDQIYEKKVLLTSGGSIVIDDALFDRYVKSTDFIQQYIFPGGCLPCPREFRAHAERAGLKVVDELAFGLDYAETLRRWRHQFMADKTQVLQLGFDERFIRIWEFYLAYCEAAFEQHNTDVLQFTLVKP